jgi:uncharacterized protein (UPF0303 family)
MSELEALLREERELQFERFTNADAWRLGVALVEAARSRAAGVTIDVRRGDQQLFHVALDGTSADNDAWIERKVRVVRRFNHSSFYVGRSLAAEGRTIRDKFLLDEAEYAPHGGAFPIIVRGVGPVGVVTVSGLPQEDDHRLVVEVLREVLGRARDAG